ncbi:MAG: hypothetical protein GX872_08510 [Firmicutes bacterium]|nr:hypothetical protein [Bacillota bacterium]
MAKQGLKEAGGLLYLLVQGAVRSAFLGQIRYDYHKIHAALSGFRQPERRLAITS